MSPPPKLSRRALTIGGIAAAGVAAMAGAIYEAPKLFRHRPRGEYADLVGKLDDTEKAVVVGRAISDRGAMTKEELSELKAALAKTSLTDIATADAKDDRLVEAGGWVLPATVATLCALAAQSV